MTQVYRVTYLEFNETLERDVFVVSLVEEVKPGNGREIHRATRFIRADAEKAAERWASLNGYTITQVREGALLPEKV